ncbi:SulP family inorganic anion transporter [Sinosporangium siamense]|uniref:Sulfate permease n=1 Tax=Sinosporangium siamense TaxID=1367973 RepID=A0A919RLI3_9ACTN|nr:SulP family inorganic anion transporter [Sinosporangium siamense]GII96010.1 sulfate permease [Sinosporangium siamense]
MQLRVRLTALFSGLLPGKADWTAYRRDPRRDLLAGITVAVVALPLALAFGVSSGAGASAGLVTAIVAGALAAVFGGSNLQVSGPTGAMTVVLVPITAQFGVNGVLLVGLLAGVLLVVLALARVGRFAAFMPTPVIEGFTAGIAVVIALQQVPAALGVTGVDGERVWAIAADAAMAFARDPQWAAPVVAVLVAVFMLTGMRWRPGVPFSLIGVALATVAAELLTLPVTRIGALPATLPMPSLDFLDTAAIAVLLPSALAVAMLAALESLLCASVADQMRGGERHEPNRELFGQGIANLVTPLFGGVPATAAIARTAVNVRAGARSRLSALVHALVLAVIVFLLAPLVSRIPLAALAGVLLGTTVRMVQIPSLRAIARATRSDGAVMGLTFVVTVALDLTTAVLVGIGVAVVLAVRAVARTVQVGRVPLPAEELGDDERIVVYRFEGPLFFAAAHRFLLALSRVTDVQVVVLRMSHVTTVDTTGAGVLGDVITQLEERGITVLLTGVLPGHGKVLEALGVAEHLRRDGLVFADTPSALAHARRLTSDQIPAVASTGV